MKHCSRSWAIGILLAGALSSVRADVDNSQDRDWPEPQPTNEPGAPMDAPQADHDNLWRLFNRFAGVTHREQAKALMRGVLRRAEGHENARVLLCDGDDADEQPPMGYEIHPDHLGDLDQDSIADLVNSLAEIANPQNTAMRVADGDGNHDDHEYDDVYDAYDDVDPDGYEDDENADEQRPAHPRCRRGDVIIEFERGKRLVFRFRRDCLQLTALRRGPCRDQELTMTLCFHGCPPSNGFDAVDQEPLEPGPQR